MIGFHSIFDLLPVIFLLGQWFCIWMIYDCAKNEPSTGNDKLAWVLIIIFLNIFGALLYYFSRRPERIRTYGH